MTTLVGEKFAGQTVLTSAIVRSVGPCVVLVSEDDGTLSAIPVGLALHCVPGVLIGHAGGEWVTVPAVGWTGAEAAALHEDFLVARQEAIAAKRTATATARRRYTARIRAEVLLDPGMAAHSAEAGGLFVVVCFSIAQALEGLHCLNEFQAYPGFEAPYIQSLQVRGVGDIAWAMQQVKRAAELYSGLTTRNAVLDEEVMLVARRLVLRGTRHVRKYARVMTSEEEAEVNAHLETAVKAAGEYEAVMKVLVPRFDRRVRAAAQRLAVVEAERDL